MSKIVPTERLAAVLLEAAELQRLLTLLRTTTSQVVRDWGIMPEEARLAELREVLDQVQPLTLTAIPETLAYLKVNLKRMERTRNAVRKMRGQGPTAYNIELPSEAPTLREDILPSFSLDEIEAKLKGLSL